MHKVIVKVFLLLLLILAPTGQAWAKTPKNVDVNYGMTNWRAYGFQTIPEEVINLLTQKNYKRAIFKLRRYMNHADGRVNPEAWLLNARALLNIQDYRIAQRTAQRVMNYFPDHPEMLAVMAMSYLYGRSDFDYAVDYAERVAEACDECRLSKHLFRLIDKHKAIKSIL